MEKKGVFRAIAIESQGPLGATPGQSSTPAASQGPPFPITIKAQRPYPPILGRLPWAAPFRVGLDRVAVSGRTPSPQFPRTLPDRIGLDAAGAFLVRQQDRARRPSQNFPYTRKATYSCRPAGHTLFVFTAPAARTFPHLHAKLFAAPSTLLLPREAVALFSDLQRVVGLSFRLSSVELTADFGIGLMEFERMGGWFRASRVAAPRRVGPGEPETFYWGSRRSARQVKLYWKREVGQACARLEYTFRRRALRRIGLDRPADLLAADWAGMAARAGRFVELDPAWGRGSVLLRWLRSVLLMLGFPALRVMEGARTPRGCRWLRSRLVDMLLQENMERAFAALSPQEPAARVGARG